MTRKSEPIHPGKILYEQAMQPLGVSRNKLARDIDVPVGRISDIVAGKRGITPDTALRLGKYFGTSAEMWMQFQSDFDLFVARSSDWKNIAPRVREMQPLEPNTVAPVTAMDAHAHHMEDSQDDPSTEPASEIAAGADEESALTVDSLPRRDGPSMHVATGEVTEDSDEKWWSTSLSATTQAGINEESAPIESADAIAPDEARRETANPDASTVADAIAAEKPGPPRTLTLGVKLKGGSVEPVDAPVSAPQPVSAEKTFEIDIRPASSESHIVADEGRQSEEVSPSPQFTVDVVREAAQTLRTAPDAIQDPENPTNVATPSNSLSDGNLTSEFDEDKLATDLPGDAFADALDEEIVPQEAALQQNQDVFAPAIARTGTDNIEQPDPPLAGPGLDYAANASASSDLGPEVQTGIGDLTPSNWSTALDAARRAEPSLAARPQSEASSSEYSATPETKDHVDVPLPSDFEPTLDGPLPPWTPPVSDGQHVSLDIPDPEEAPKLFEYDD